MSTHHHDDILGPTSSIKGRLRGMFGQRSKVTVTPYPPTISMPTRMPIRNKRNFTEVTDDEQDRGSSINPRARARQRLDSTIPPHLVSSKTLSRTASNDSMRTICAREPRPSRTLSTSTIVLDPGRSAPARAVLTRTTTHNQLTPPPEDKASIPFPSKKRTLCPSKQQTTQSKLVASAKTPASPPTIPRESSLRKSKPLPAQSKFLSDSSPATPLRVEEEPGSFAAAMATEIPRSSQTRGTRITEPGPLSPEDIMLQQVLEYVVHETDDDEEEDEELDALLAASYARNVTRNSSLASMMSIDKHGNEFPALQLPPPVKAPTPSPRSPRMGVKSRLDRFDVRTQPCNNHTAIWDLEASDVYSWPALLCITDKEFKHTGFETRLPIQSVEIEFHSVGDTGIVHAASTSHSHDDQHLSNCEFSTHYHGTVTQYGHGTPRLVETDGICIMKAWNVGPFHNSVAASEKYETESPVDASYFLKFYVPIPMRLFEGREYRKFNVKSRVVFGAWDLDPILAHSGTVQVTIEHLRKEFHMDGTKPLSSPSAARS